MDDIYEGAGVTGLAKYFAVFWLIFPLIILLIQWFSKG